MFSSVTAFLLFTLLLVAFGQEDVLEGERCNDVILYDIIKKAAKSTSDAAEIRQKAMETMGMVFPLARSMGCICTSHQFRFPEFVNHRYCSVRLGAFRCHAIVF